MSGEGCATPVTPQGLAQYDNLDPVVAVIKAWKIEGQHPVWHRRVQSILRTNMPVLVRALDRLAENCPTCRTGMSRETTNLICATCGTDYGKKH